MRIGEEDPSMPKPAKVLTPPERRIMQVLWDDGAGNVQKVLQGLNGEPQLAYTTIQTTLNVLHRIHGGLLPILARLALARSDPSCVTVPL